MRKTATSKYSERALGERLILAGASGLIGTAAIPALAQAGFDVHVMARRDLSAVTGVTSHIAPANMWPEIVTKVGARIAISCLGTTMRIAGSQTAFATVDLELVCDFASAAKKAGANQFIAVSSAGASAASSNFYLKTKGQMETAVGALGFERADFLRPGLLRGERGGERRFGERMGIILSPLTDMILMGPLQRYRSIAAEDVASAICALALKPGARSRFYENEEMLILAKEPK
jgi:uncharacterized protein YbjT (DUF2867 family)